MPTPDDDLLSPLIRRDATRHAPPAGLAERISADLRAATVAAQPAVPTTPPPAFGPLRSSAWRRWLNPGLVFAAGAATAGLMFATVLRPTAGDHIGDEIAASHVRSLMAAHLTDVTSTDRHTVKPWFAGKLDFSPPVYDLAAQGYPLSGGRLDVIGGRPVAALVYRERDHVINVFIWPGPDQPVQRETRQGFNITGWSQSGMRLWAVTDASAADLQAFADALRTHIATP